MKVSVIIPAYNSARWVRKCAKSITSQSYKNLEIIFVNDGSNDGTLDILHKLAEGDRRIRVINKPNTGTYPTRRLGVLQASGDAIVHVDADDFLPPDAIKVLVHKLVDTGADIVIGDYFKVIGKKKRLCTNKITEKRNKKILMKGLLDNDITSYLWGKIYRKNLMLDMPDVTRPMLYEDLYTNLQIFAKNELYIEHIDLPVYNYNIHNSNSTKTKNSDLIESVFEINIIAEDLLKEEGFLPDLTNEFSAFKCRNWIVYSRMGGVLTFDKSFRKEFYKNNFQKYAQRHMVIYQKLEMVFYTYNLGMGHILTGFMKGLQKVVY